MADGSLMADNGDLLVVQNLKTYFDSDAGDVRAVDGVDFTIKRGEVLGLVGESGCGKSVTSLSVMRLIPQPPGDIVDGQILFEGQDLLQLSPIEMRHIRGNRMSMIFQEPMTSLNPVYTIGNQLCEPLELHQRLSKTEALARAREMLELVHIPDAARRLREYPHQLSGGMRQRVMIAMALACHPALLIADEPTTALDVTIQAQILELMKQLQHELGTAILLITHDLGVIAEMAQRVAVMYTGRIVEYGNIMEVFHNPQHPYTRGLLRSIPRLDSAEDLDELPTIPGTVPNLLRLPSGCPFQNRCPDLRDACRTAVPPLTDVGAGHLVRCVLVQ
jgi:oligopeptide/dipeptide ABC transporter ATP-binding protein